MDETINLDYDISPTDNFLSGYDEWQKRLKKQRSLKQTKVLLLKQIDNKRKIIYGLLAIILIIIIALIIFIIY